MLNKGEIIKRETRRWNELTKTSQLMRKKEDLLDYRYFEEPDLPPLHITNAMIEQAKKRLKPTKAQHLATLVHEYGMTQKEADFLFANADILAYFKLVYPDFSDTTALLSWLMGDWLSFAKAKMQADTQFSLAKLLPKKDDFIYLLTAIKSQTISRKNAKSALEHIILTNQSAKEYIASNNLHQSTHVDEEIAHFAKLCLEQNAPLVNEYIQGKTKVFAFFMGQLIKRYPSTSPKVLKEALLSAFKQYSA